MVSHAPGASGIMLPSPCCGTYPEVGRSGIARSRTNHSNAVSSANSITPLGTSSHSKRFVYDIAPSWAPTESRSASAALNGRAPSP